MGSRRIPKVPDYWWFPEASTAELAGRLVPGARLKVTPYLKDGEWALMLDTMPTGGVTTQSHTGINDSHACPPWCGGG